MSRWYEFLYRFGITPWEEDPTGPTGHQIANLFDREEAEREPPYGRALDLGCGTGIWSVELAKRGWRVTGVDIVAKAVSEARRRADAEGVTARFVQGDVTALRTAGVESGFELVVDFECFNHLDAVKRKAVGVELSALTVPNATMLMLVWAPGRRGPMPPGASRSDIEEAFPDWSIVHEEAYEAQAQLPGWLQNIGLRFCRLRRRTAS